jgi:FkbM family methyltransferase
MTAARLLDRLLAAARRLGRAVVPPGRSPRFWRRLVRALQRSAVYDRASRTVTVQHGPLRGMRKYGPFCESDFAFALGRFEPEVSEALRRHARLGMTALDLGANAGHLTLLLAHLVGRNGQVHAFEPVPEDARCLEETTRINALPNVTVHAAAVADRTGSAELAVAGAFDGAARLVELATQNGAATDRRVIRVPVTTLDDFCAREGLERVDLVKMDIEGAERLALAGMEAVLARHRPVLVAELWGAESIAAVPPWLEARGYRVTVLTRWSGVAAGRPAETANILAVPAAPAAEAER